MDVQEGPRLCWHSSWGLGRERRWRLDWVGLGFLPLILLVCYPDRFISPPDTDCWLYFGYYLNLPHYLQTFDGLYYTTRLSVTLPGWLIYRLLPPLAANFVLHLGLHSISVTTLYLTLKDTVNRRAAFLTALVFGCHAFVLRAVGRDYVDGFGVTYFLLAAWLLTAATRSLRQRAWLLAAGAAALALAVANITYFLLVPFLIAHYLILNHERQQQPAFVGIGWFAGGMAGLFLLLGGASFLMAGRFWFLLPSLTWLCAFAREPGPNPWQRPLGTWWLEASWLILPVAAALGACLLLYQASSKSHKSFPGLIRFYQVQLLTLLLAIILVSPLGRTCLLQFPHYASMLLPALFLALGGQIGGCVEKLEARAYRALALLVYVVSQSSLAALKLPADVTQHLGDLQLLPALVAGLTAVLLLRLPQPTWPIGFVTMLLLAASNLLGQSTEPTRHSLANARGPMPAEIDRVRDYHLVAQAFRTVRKVQPAGHVWFWYSEHDPTSPLYTMIASTHLYMYRLVNLNFPSLPELTTVSGLRLAPGVLIAILSRGNDAFPLAHVALQQHGLACRLIKATEIRSGTVALTLTIIEIIQPIVQPAHGA